MDNEKEYREAYEKIMKIYREQFDPKNPLFELVKTDQYGIYYGKEFNEQYKGDIIRFASDLEKSLE